VNVTVIEKLLVVEPTIHLDFKVEFTYIHIGVYYYV